MICDDRPLLLGSASPRRRELLAAARIPLRVVAAAVDEQWESAEPALDYLVRVVDAKLRAVAAAPAASSCAAVLAADTTVVVDGEVLGKPASVDEAAVMVGRLVGRGHTVLTRYAFAATERPREPLVSRTVETRVFMRAATAAEVERYAASGEGLDKAGAYAVQGLGAFLVTRIDGSYSNVVGLPLCEVLLDLYQCGLLEGLP